MDWITTTNGLITLITGGVTLLGSLIGLFFSIRAWVRAQKKNDNNNIWSTIMMAADAAMEAVEASNLQNKGKKDMAIDMVKASCVAISLDITPFLDQLSAYIDECIAFHNGMNAANKARK